MKTGRMVLIGAAAGAVALLALGLAWLYSPSTGPSVTGGTAATRTTARPLDGAVGGGVDGAASVAATRSARGPGSATAVPGGAPVEGAAATTAPGAQIGARLPPAPHRAFASSEEAAAFVEARVVDLFAAVAPDIDPDTIEQTCSDDGRDCTFEGPWPGDDFMGRWITAVSDGRTSLEAMQGVTFSTFKPVGEGEHRRFLIQAHVP